MAEQPSSSAVWEANMFQEETLAAPQNASKFHQGILKFPSLVISTNLMEESTLLHTTDLEQQSCTALYKSNDEEKRTHSSWEHSNGSFIDEAMVDGMIYGRHLEMRNPFSFLDYPFSMRTPPLKEKPLPVTDPEPYGFWEAIDGKKVSWGDLMRGALQHIME